MFKFLYTLLVALFLTPIASAQKANYFKRVFVDAEYYFLYEEFKDAVPLYLEILSAYPDNANISYRIGVCYLNIPNEKHKSVPFFQNAIKKVSPSYKEGYFTEYNAPRDVFLQYGIALRIQGDFEKALLVFETYRSMLSEQDANEFKELDKQIQYISFAKEMKANPVQVKFTSVGRAINTRFSELNPMISADGRLMVYTSTQQFYNAILISYFEKGEWTHPVNLNSQMLADGPIKSVGISGDGNTIVLSRNDNDDYNLYTSSYDAYRKVWSPMVRLPKEVNTRYWENFGSFNHRGDTLYFSSNKPGGLGGYDIYYTVKTSTGWSNPLNLGSTINTPFDDIAPYIDTKSQRLFFASKGHQGMGGYDIFVAHKQEGQWAKPINMGYPINTTDDDEAFFPVGIGNLGLISRLRSETFGEEDIYWVEYEGNIDEMDDLSFSPVTLEHGNEQLFNSTNSNATVK